MTTPCPCGLNRQEVLLLHSDRSVPMLAGKCQNPRADGTEGVCNHALGAHQPITPQGNVRYFQCTVYLKRQKVVVKHFSNYDQLLCELQKVDKWRKVLRYYDFRILAKYSADDKRELKHNEPLPVDLPSDLIIELVYRGFSSWKHHEEEALTYVGSLFKRIDRIVPSDEEFPSNSPLNIELNHIDMIVGQLKMELNARLEAVNLEIPSELTCREFISPFLIASIRIVASYLKFKQYTNKLSLVYEKYVYGLKASGPVDYIIMLDYLDIILTEAKKETAKEGIIQNLLQQHASLEFLSNILIDTDIVGFDRKKRFRETFEDIRLSFPTFGIVSTGSEWIFTKCVRQDDPKEKTKIYRSSTVSINFTNSHALNDLEPTIRKILYTISNIMIIQVENVKDFEPNKKMKGLDPIQLVRMETSEGKELREEEGAFSDEDEPFMEEEL